MDFLNFLMKPLGQFLYFIYETVAFKNYGWTIIIFTVIVKMALLPLTYKQQKSSLEMQKIQPHIQEINEKYKNDKAKLSTETMALYKEHNVNPIGSCLPMLFQFPILIALYQVISRPLTYLLTIDSAKVTSITDILKGLQIKLPNYPEVGIIKNLTEGIAQTINTSFSGLGSLLLELQRGMNFYGLKLYEIPTTDPKVIMANLGLYLPLLALIIAATIITFISSKLSMVSMNKRNNHHKTEASKKLELEKNNKLKVNNKSNNQPEKKSSQMAMTNNMMLYLGPIMTLFISFSVPAGVTLYWAVGYVIMIIQQLIMNKAFYSTKEVNKANG
ncbi:MAG TPA: YidC/Oxa1 family membrane protein insertase [Clostridia bacterium]|nr:YidC/Oxa1 family membrane protein insertase [Clostridia bacterium]